MAAARTRPRVLAWCRDGFNRLAATGLAMKRGAATSDRREISALALDHPASIDPRHPPSRREIMDTVREPVVDRDSVSLRLR